MDTETKTPTKAVFNKGERIYRHNDVELKPGTFTQLPEPDANMLLDKFGHELVTDASMGAKTDHGAEVERLRKENEQLKNVINSEPEDSKAGANRRAQAAEIENEQLKKRLAELESKDMPKISAKVVKGSVVAKDKSDDEFESGNKKG